MDIPNASPTRRSRRNKTEFSSTFPRIHPDVTQRRLAYIARLVLKVWQSVRRTHRPKKGDTMWGFGTRFHERMCHCLREAAKRFPWIRLIEHRLRFVFTIGAAPFRFYRGYAGRPRKNYLIRNKPETDQQKLAGIELDWCCRIAIEGGDTNEAPRVILVQHSESSGAVRNAWVVNPDGEAVPQPTAAAATVPAPALLAEAAPPEPAPEPLSLAREPAVQPRPVIRMKKASESEADEGS